MFNAFSYIPFLLFNYGSYILHSYLDFLTFFIRIPLSGLSRNIHSYILTPTKAIVSSPYMIILMSRVAWF